MAIRHRFVSAKSDDADTTLVRPSNWNDDHTIDPTTSSTIFEDCFYHGATDYYGGGVKGIITSGGNVDHNNTSIARRPGIVNVNTGTNTAGKLDWMQSDGTTAIVDFRLVDTELVMGSYAQVNALSDGTNRYVLRNSGFVSTNNFGGSHSGAFFRYTDNVNSGKFEAVTRLTSSETATDTGVTFAAATWYKFEIRIPAAADEVEFYINDSLVATNTTNLPANTSVGLLVASMQKTAGTTSRQLQVDAYWMTLHFTTSR